MAMYSAVLVIFFLCVISAYIGRSLGVLGIVAFTQPQKLGGSLLIVLAGIPVSAWLLVWLQNTYGFQVQTWHLIVVGLSFAIPFLLARAAKSSIDPHIDSGSDDFRKAAQIFAPYFNQYYKAGQNLTNAERYVINDSRDQLQQAINLFQSARVSRLNGATITDNFRQDAAAVLVEIGLIYRLLGDLSQARKHFLQAHKELNTLFPSNTLPNLPAKLGITCLRLGDVEHIDGNFGEARKWYQQAIPLLEKAANDANLQLARNLLSHLP